MMSECSHYNVRTLYRMVLLTAKINKYHEPKKLEAYIYLFLKDHFQELAISYSYTSMRFACYKFAKFNIPRTC